MVFAVNHISSPGDAESATTVRSPITVREEAPKTRSYVGADGNFLGVTLVSAYLPSDVRDGGDAIANAADDGKEPGLTAVETAEKYAAAALGDDFEGMTLIDVSENGEVTYVTFARTYGDGGFVHGLYCRVSVKSGQVISHSVSGGNPPDDFDTGLLDGVTADQVLAYAASRAEKIFTDLEKTEIHKISIDKQNGKFAPGFS